MMTEFQQQDSYQTTHGDTPSPARPGRGLRFAALGLIIISVALWALWPRSRPVKHGWPETLTRGAAQGFNVVILTLDTTRANRLGCYGHVLAQTPTLDRIAAEGIRVDDAVTVVPVTLPSHATIFTGLIPPHHGVRNNGEFHLDPKHRTLAEIVRDEGYETAAFVSAFVLDARFGLDQGFDVYDDSVDFAVGSGLVKQINERRASAVTNAAIDWLDARTSKRPFLLWVHYFDPHSPYEPPEPFAGRFSNSLYDGELAYMDSQIGRLFQTLKDKGLADKTLTVVVADHGESLGDHGEGTHGKLIYDSSMRVPLLISCPGLVEGPYVLNDRVVSTTDIVPTVLDLLNIESTGPFDGVSMLTQTPGTDRAAYMETLASYLDDGWSPLYGLRRHDDKYILAPRREYYDLTADPKELNNLFDTDSKEAQIARDVLVADMNALLATVASLAVVVAGADPLDDESIRRLEALGYVGTLSEPAVDDALADPKDMMPVLEGIDRCNALARVLRFDEALAAIKKAKALSPRNPRVLMTLGKLYLQMDRMEDAEAAFRAAATYTKNPRVGVAAAQSMLSHERPELAVEFLEPLRASHPNNPDILINLGIAYIHTGRANEGRDILLEAIRRDASLFEAHINLASYYLGEGQEEEALDFADRAVALAPSLGQAHYTQGRVLRKLGRNQEAADSLNNAVRLDVRNRKFLLEAGNACIRAKRFSDALEHFSALSDLMPSRWEPWFGRARANFGLRQYGDAERAIEAALDLAPDEPRLLDIARQLAERRIQKESEGE